MSKSPEAFRTISEVAEWLDTPAHVLRFWENRFSQIRPIKRAGGRRYYRPADMQLLGGIRKLLHEDGLTIRGVQKILREQGVKYVASLSPELDLGAPCPPAEQEQPAPEPARTAAEPETAPPAPAPAPAPPPDLSAARALLTTERLAALSPQQRADLAGLARRFQALARRMDDG